MAKSCAFSHIVPTMALFDANSQFVQFGLCLHRKWLSRVCPPHKSPKGRLPSSAVGKKTLWWSKRPSATLLPPGFTRNNRVPLPSHSNAPARKGRKYNFIVAVWARDDKLATSCVFSIVNVINIHYSFSCSNKLKSHSYLLWKFHLALTVKVCHLTNSFLLSQCQWVQKQIYWPCRKAELAGITAFRVQ